jgi:hypothetical protein
MRIVFDRYMLHARKLAADPELIGEDWNDAVALFRCVDNRGCGCLTQVRMSGIESAAYERPEIRDLCLAIAADPRIPAYFEDITVDHLPVFVEWQRRLDAELGEDRNG